MVEQVKDKHLYGSRREGSHDEDARAVRLDPFGILDELWVGLDLLCKCIEYLLCGFIEYDNQRIGGNGKEGQYEGEPKRRFGSDRKEDRAIKGHVFQSLGEFAQGLWCTGCGLFLAVCLPCGIEQDGSFFFAQC